MIEVMVNRESQVAVLAERRNQLGSLGLAKGHSRVNQGNFRTIPNVFHIVVIKGGNTKPFVFWGNYTVDIASNVRWLLQTGRIQKSFLLRLPRIDVCHIDRGGFVFVGIGTSDTCRHINGNFSQALVFANSFSF
jgi:hypothetical protein